MYPSSFTRFAAEGIDIYLARDIWDSMEPGTDRLSVQLPGYGQVWLRFERSEDPTSHAAR
jgi:hypothetical protein